MPLSRIAERGRASWRSRRSFRPSPSAWTARTATTPQWNWRPAKRSPRSHEQLLALQVGVERRHELGIAVVEQGRARLVVAKQALRGLAPARMRDLRIDVGP